MVPRHSTPPPRSAGRQTIVVVAYGPEEPVVIRDKPVRHADAFGALKEAFDRGLVVHAPHPDFGGTLTAGRSRRADGSRVWEMIQHGGTVDVGNECTSASDLARQFVYQVGKRAAFAGACAALERAAGRTVMLETVS